MRVAIYARHSSDNQREASIEDQLEVCRRYAERQGWTIVKGLRRPGAERRQPVPIRVSSRCRWTPRPASSI